MLKRLYVICLCLFCAVATYSQNISVASFKMDENDITANMEGTMVYDQNGEKCALIRIQTTQTGFTFDVGALGVRDVVQKTGEIWLYVPYGVRRVTIRHQQLGTMEYAFPMSIEKARTYVMQLTTGEVPPDNKDVIKSQYILFRLTPSNALVELDGQVLETVDGTATKRMPFGTYNYRVQAPRHAPSVGVVTVNDSKNKHIVTVNLVPQFTNVTFRVSDNAEIWIDDQLRGNGSCTLELSFGTYLVECRKDGCRTSQQEVEVNKESALNAISLKAPTPIFGAVDINTSPADAEVWIDGKQAGTTPIFLSECLIGKHQVTFKKSSYKERALTFDVTEGQTATVMESLEKMVVEPLHADGTSGNTITEEVFMVVEQMPEFPGGMAKLMEYLSQNVRYPALAMQQRVQGRVVVEFVVNKDGSISDESILRSVHPLLNEEALRLVKNMPKWSPGMQRGKAVRVRYTIPVLFRLQ